MTRAAGDRNEEVAEVHLEHDRLADVRRDERRDRSAGSKAVSGVVWWNRQQDRVQQFALKLLQARFGRFDQAERAGWLAHPSIAVMAKRLDRIGAFAGLAIGEPVELVGHHVEEAGQIGWRCDRRNRPRSRRPRRRGHLRLFARS